MFKLKQSSLGLILKQSLKTVWQTPVLWLFGFFIAPLVSLEMSFLVDTFDQYKNVLKNQIGGNFLLGPKIITEFLGPNSFEKTLIFCLIILIFFILAIFSQISLTTRIKGFQKETGQKLSFKKLISLSAQYFWPVSLYNLFNLLIIGVVFFIFNPFAFQLISRLGEKFYLLIPLIVISALFILFSLCVSFIVKFSVFYLVLEERSFFKAVRSACLFFLKTWLPTLGLFIVLALAGLILALGLSLVFITTSIPFWGLISLFYFLKSSFGVSLVFILILITYLAILFLTSSMFSSFQLVSWILFFKNKISQEKAKILPVDKQ